MPTATAKPFARPIDMTGNEVRNAHIQVLPSDPDPVTGPWLYIRASSGMLRRYDPVGLTYIDTGLLLTAGAGLQLTGTDLSLNVDGSTLEINADAVRVKAGGIASSHIADGTIVNADISGSAAIALSKLALDPLARANHTGTQAIATVSSLQTTLDAKLAIASVGVAGGAASLDGGGKIPSTQLPAIGLTDVNVVASIAARDALTVQEGDVAIVTANGTTYIYDGSAWQVIQTPVDGVTAVTGGTGITSTGGNTPQLSLTPGGVGTASLTDGAVNSAKIADNTIVDADINSAAGIARSKLNFGSGLVNADIATAADIGGSKIADTTITGAKLANLTVTGSKITDGTITSGKMGTNSVATNSLQDGSVTTAKLAADAATRAKLDPSVRTAVPFIAYDTTTTNTNVASAPSTINGSTGNTGNTYLLAGQTTGTENGLWVYNGVGVAMTRPAGWETGTVIQPFQHIAVFYGLNAGLWFVNTSAAQVVGTDAPLFARKTPYLDLAGDPFGLPGTPTAPPNGTAGSTGTRGLGRTYKHGFSAQTIGLGVTDYDVYHFFGTQYVTPKVFYLDSSLDVVDEVEVRVVPKSGDKLNAVTVMWPEPLATGTKFLVMVHA